MKRLRTSLVNNYRLFKQLRTYPIPNNRLGTLKSIKSYIYDQEFKKVYAEYKKKKTIDEKKQIFVQHELYDIMNMTPTEIFKNEDMLLINNELPNKIMQKLKDGIILNHNNPINQAYLQFSFLSVRRPHSRAELDNYTGLRDFWNMKLKNLKTGGKGTSDLEYYIRHTESERMKHNTVIPLDIKIGSPTSEYRSILLGYRFAYNAVAKNMTQNNIMELKAFHPQTDRKFHELTYASTNYDKLCIYMTFLDQLGIKDLKYLRKSKETREEIKQMLKNEGSEIEESIKKGLLVESLVLLTRKYETRVMIIFYDQSTNTIAKMINPKNEYPIVIDRGEIIICSTDEKYYKYYEMFYKKKVFLYEKNLHVAPAILDSLPDKKYEEIEKKHNDKFSLKPIKLKKRKRKYKSLLGFDCETYKDENNVAVPYCICVYGKLLNDIVEKSFYGSDCVNEFINYLEEIKTPVNRCKSRPKNKINNIFIYGFNNSRFDNFLFFRELYKINPKTKFVFASKTIKTIKYDNITYFDFACQYAGYSLKDITESFGLEESKGVYPYKFDNKNNIYYNGVIPHINYWNSTEEYEEYMNEYGYSFNKKEYCIKYCMLDSKLVYELANYHLGNTEGVINDRIFNVDSSPTSANLSIKTYQQVFQKDILFQSPDNVVEDERESYHGGRTSVFRTYFKANKGKLLYYVDINSAHPSGMTLDMPYKYLKTNTFRQEQEEDDHELLCDYYLYHARTVYKGNNIHYIPNLLHNTEDKKLIATTDAPYSYYWGMELKESIKDGCIVYYDKVHTYAAKPIFKEFIEYFYGKRLEAKSEVKKRLLLEKELEKLSEKQLDEKYDELLKEIKESKGKYNETHIIYYKAIINSLYGKFGQKAFGTTLMVKDVNEMFSHLKGDLRQVTDWEYIETPDGEGYVMFSYRESGDVYGSIGKLVRFSSYIAMTTRTKLADLMRHVGHKNVYYCDTDSIFTSVKPDDSYIHPTQLGKWNYECDPIVNAKFLAPKVYYYETAKGKVDKKSKGIRAADLETDDYDYLSKDSKNIIESRKRTMFFRSYNGVTILEKSRKLRCVLNKRRWYKNGTSKPFKNDEEYNKYNKNADN
jgi:hypothetical protein